MMGLMLSGVSFYWENVIVYFLSTHNNDWNEIIIAVFVLIPPLLYVLIYHCEAFDPLNINQAGAGCDQYRVDLLIRLLASFFLTLSVRRFISLPLSRPFGFRNAGREIVAEVLNEVSSQCWRSLQLAQLLITAVIRAAGGG